jgi:hypothetical protein
MSMHMLVLRWPNKGAGLYHIARTRRWELVKLRCLRKDPGGETMFPTRAHWSSTSKPLLAAQGLAMPTPPGLHRTCILRTHSELAEVDVLVARPDLDVIR